MLKGEKEFLGKLKKVRQGQRAGLFLAVEGEELYGAALALGDDVFMYALPVEENVQLSLFTELPGAGEGGERASLQAALTEFSATVFNILVNCFDSS